MRSEDDPIISAALGAAALVWMAVYLWLSFWIFNVVLGAPHDVWWVFPLDITLIFGVFSPAIVLVIYELLFGGKE